MEETKNLTLNETPLAEEPEKEEALSDRVRVISPGRMVLKRFFRSKLSVIGLCLMLFLFLFSFIGPLFTGWEQNEIDRSIRQVVYSPSQLTDDCYYVGEVENTVAKLAPPMSRSEDGRIHILGTDKDGRDNFTRLMYGGRISLTLSLAVVIINTIIGVIIGVWILAHVERFIRKHIPDVLDLIVTPLVSVLLVGALYVFVLMPITGYISDGLVYVLNLLVSSANPVVSVISGYVLAALFLPMVAMGMHHGLVALYSVQLESFGYVTLYPALAMAGAGQVGAAVAIYFKAKKCGNTRLKNVITGALPAGLLGIGEPLIYGVTLPMGKPFISAGLGAGFGGAFVMAMQVAATAWGPSGLLALFVMTAGPHGVAASVGCYAVGLVICYIMGFIVTNAMVSVEDVANA